MTDEQKCIITDLRNKGFSYAQISEQTGISRNTIKSFCRRNKSRKVYGNREIDSYGIIWRGLVKFHLCNELDRLAFVGMTESQFMK